MTEKIKKTRTTSATKEVWIREQLSIYGFCGPIHISRKFGVSARESSLFAHGMVKRNDTEIKFDKVFNAITMKKKAGKSGH